MAVKECPMCGEWMRMHQHSVSDTVPGTGEKRTVVNREWVCPECDYFEEVEE